MSIVRFRKKTIVIGVIGFLVVIVGIAAAIGATRSFRAAGDGSGTLAATAPAFGDQAGADRDLGELEKSADGAATAQAEGGAGDVNAALPPLAGGMQYLVRSGQLTIVVKKGALDEAVSEVTTITRAFEGYILSSMVGSWSSDGNGAPVPLESTGDEAVVSSEMSTAGDPYAYVTIRVPADRFDDALVRLQRLGKVRELNTSTDDVTAQIVDLRARLRHYRAVEERLLSFLDKADTVAAALAVQDRIDRTQLMVEEIEAQMKQLDETVTYSTLSISLSEKGSAPTTVSDDSDSFWGAITHSLRLVGDGFRWIAVALGAALPFLVVFGVVGVVVFYVARRVSRRRHSGRPGPPAPVTGGPPAIGGTGAD